MNKNAFEFSVLMSVYKNDSSDFFCDALKSVTTNQTLKPKQVVIVKDGPVDEKIDTIVNAIKIDNPSIEFDIVSNSENKGLAYSLNIGSRLINTDWIARMDSDDIAVPSRFELQINYLKKNPSVSIVGGLTEEFNIVPKDMHRIREVPINHTEIIKMLKKRNPMNHPSVIYNKKAFDRIGGYSTDYGKMEDYKLWVDFSINNYVFANIDSVLVNMRVGSGFLSRRSNKEEIQDWKKIQRYIWTSKINTWFRMKKNIMIFSLFVRSPLWLKKIAYSKFLRRRSRVEKDGYTTYSENMEQ